MAAERHNPQLLTVSLRSQQSFVVINLFRAKPTQTVLFGLDRRNVFHPVATNP